MPTAAELFVDAVSTQPVVWIGLVFVFGLLIGSFLNVVIHRVPIMLERQWRAEARQVLAEQDTVPHEHGLKASTQADHPAHAGSYNLIVPRSACPKCGAQLTAWQNIPVISYLLLKGQCAHCRARISLRYPLVELGTALLSALVAWKFGLGWYTAAALLLTWVLIALSGIDIDHQLLPDNMTLPLMWFGLLLSLFPPISELALPVDPRSSILGAVAGYISLWTVYQGFKLLTGKEGMGYGDFKLFAALGAWLGWQMLPLIILLAALTGAVIGIALIVFRGRDREIPLPFGPYLAAAGWIALMWGSDLVGSYLQLTGMRGPG